MIFYDVEYQEKVSSGEQNPIKRLLHEMRAEWEMQDAGENTESPLLL
jgi:hypothetical protein